MTIPTVTLPVDPHMIQRVGDGEYATWVPEQATVYIVSGSSVSIFAVEAMDDRGFMLVLRRDAER